MRVLLSRVRGVLYARQLDRDLNQEIASHLEEATDEYIRQGLSPAEARRTALGSFGGVVQAQEAYREVRSFAPLDAARRDLSQAVRALWRAPGFAATIIVTLALGIGANTAVFSAVYAALLRPLPYERPDEIFSVEVVIPGRQGPVPSLPVRVQDYLEWRRTTTDFSAVTALVPAAWNLEGGSESRRVGGARVPANFFGFLGLPVAYGRGFLPQEEQPGQDHVVVISDALWRSRYGRDPAVLNSHILLNDNSYLVVGIAPPSLLVPTGTTLHPLLVFASSVDIWQPLAPTPREMQGESWSYGLLVRLPPGKDAEVGRLQLQTLLNQSLREQTPDLTIELQTKLVPIREVYAGRIRSSLWLVFGAAGLLLIAACTSVANVYLGRTVSRSREFALRVALGARRRQVLVQVLTESMCLALLGGAAGIALAYVGTPALLAQGPRNVQALNDVSPNLPVLLVSILASLLTGIVCGILPVRQALRTDPHTVLKEGARGTVGGGRAARTRQVLVGIEMALSAVLLVSAGLLLHSFLNVTQANRGYAVDRVVTIELTPGGSRYSAAAQRVAYYNELLGKISSTPGVLAVGAISNLPALAETGTQTIYLPTDIETPELTLQRPAAGIRSATPGYFSASRTALRAGRVFNDSEATPVAVISESLGRRLWPGESAANVVGRTIAQGGASNPPSTVVGVVEDVRSGDLDRELAPQLYRPHAQMTTAGMTVLVRTAQDPAGIVSSVRETVRQHDPTVPIVTARTMREIVSGSLDRRRFQMALTVLFGVVALLLGAVGVYGVVSYSVVRRTRDIGLRIALGASPRTILGRTVLEGMRPVVVGLSAGMFGAIVLAQSLQHLLFGIGPLDRAALGSVTLLLLVTATTACYLPARRASRLDPIAALRHE